MKKALACLVLSVAVLATTVAEAGYYRKGGFTLASHVSGRTYSRSSVRYMTGRGPGSTWFIAGAGHYDTRRNAVIDTYVWSKVSYRGQWAAGPRGTVLTDPRRRNENFVLAFANNSRYAIVDNIDLY
jgi:hypothetical protein